MAKHFERLVKSMEYQLNEQNKYMTEALKAYLIGRMTVCNGYDEQTRQELIEEYLELEAV